MVRKVLNPPCAKKGPADPHPCHTTHAPCGCPCTGLFLICSLTIPPPPVVPILGDKLTGGRCSGMVSWRYPPPPKPSSDSSPVGRGCPERRAQQYNVWEWGEDLSVSSPLSAHRLSVRPCRPSLAVNGWEGFNAVPVAVLGKKKKYLPPPLPHHTALL
eukprot:Sspe_Gene.68135::Locus_40199_Transcript_1_1_Confidence_1.000_Length_678::g.68135::m.68135